MIYVYIYIYMTHDISLITSWQGAYDSMVGKYICTSMYQCIC